jgi:hypothetical protein
LKRPFVATAVPGVPLWMIFLATRTVTGVPAAWTLSRYRFRYTRIDAPASSAARPATASVPARLDVNFSAISI